MKTIFFILCFVSYGVFAETQTDIEYARVGDQMLKLDLYRPKPNNPPLLIYVHGDAWRAGSKAHVPILNRVI
jgi:acetyl esterase/lipase